MAQHSHCLGFFSRTLSREGYQLRYVDDVCIILSRYFLAYWIWTLDPGPCTEYLAEGTSIRGPKGPRGLKGKAP